MTDLWPVQQAALDWIEQHPRAWLEIPVGGGKTRVVCETINNNAQREGFHRVLVLCPTRVCTTWMRELGLWADMTEKEMLAPGTPLKQRSDRVRYLANVTSDDKLPQWVLVTNYEALLSDGFLRAALAYSPDLIVCDEAQRLKAPGGQLYKRVRRLVEKSEADAILMSGTVMPHSPLDLWSQSKIIDPDTFAGPFSRYRSAVAVMGGPQQTWVTGFRVDPKDKAHFDPQTADWLAAKLAPILFRGEIDHGIGLVSSFRTHPLPGDIRALYTKLERDMVLEVATSRTETRTVLDLNSEPYEMAYEISGDIAPQNALVHLLRLAQLASGLLPADDGESFLSHTERYEALVELLEDVNEPVVVGCRFRHELENTRLAATHLGRSYGEISGRRSDGLTPEGRHAGQQVLGVQYQAGGVGVDLSYASLAVLAGHTYSLGDYDQFIGRLRRPGQRSDTVRVVHLLASDTVDQAVYDALDTRRDVIAAVKTSIERAR